MTILFFGDIVGRLGRRAVARILPEWKKECQPDLVIANVENLAHGIGVTKKTLDEIRAAGVDFCTSGNHIFKKPESMDILADSRSPVLRPANYPEGTPGTGHRLITLGNQKILVINLLGRLFMDEGLACPFRTADAILNQYRGTKLNAVIVDFHAEATSEKAALGWYLDGRVSLVVGTHSHVPTADAKIMPQGTAFITDAGMNGGRDTSLGVDKDLAIKRFLEQSPVSLDWPDQGVSVVNAVLAEIDPNTAKAIKIKLLQTEVLI